MPARAAYSHSASVGSRNPSQLRTHSHCPPSPLVKHGMSSEATERRLRNSRVSSQATSCTGYSSPTPARGSLGLLFITAVHSAWVTSVRPIQNPDTEALRAVPSLAGGSPIWKDAPLRKIIEKAGVDFRFALPHTAFHRDIGEFKAINATPKGVLLNDADWAKVRDDYLPSKADGDFIESLMRPVSEPGRFAGWIAAPKVGIDNKPGDFEYVKIAA